MPRRTPAHRGDLVKETKEETMTDHKAEAENSRFARKAKAYVAWLRWYNTENDTGAESILANEWIREFALDLFEGENLRALLDAAPNETNPDLFEMMGLPTVEFPSLKAEK